MKAASDPYEDAAFVYVRLVRQISEAAADAIEQVHAGFGSDAALHAALIIMIMKMEVQQNDWLPSIGLYDHLLGDYPDALPLMKYAMTCCLQAWGRPVTTTDEWVNLEDNSE